VGANVTEWKQGQRVGVGWHGGHCFVCEHCRDGDFATVAGSYAGTAKDAQDTMEFSALTGVHPMIERYPLSRVAEAYERMLGGRMRFRGVLTFGV
jgi:D-arabinose 1-dehydrogenase-like Zn-dependent alcohol dehydrogenase